MKNRRGPRQAAPQTFQAAVNPAPQCGWVRKAIRVAARRRSLFQRGALFQSGQGLLAGVDRVVPIRQQPGRKHRNAPAALLANAAPHPDPALLRAVRLPATPPMSDHRNLPATWALPWKPLASFRHGLAFAARTWDNYYHLGRRRRPGVQSRPRNTASGLRLRSYISKNPLKKNHTPPLPVIGRFTFTTQNEDYFLSYQHAAIRNARLHATLKLECSPWPRVEIGCRNVHYPPIHKKI